MARIALIAEGDTKAPEIVEAIRERRGGRLLQMDRVMLHSSTYAGAWNSFLKTVTQDLVVPLKMRELIMCVVGVLNNALYETFSHSPRFLAAGGTQAQLDALSNLPGAIANTMLFDAQERAVLRLTMEMTTSVQVSAATFEEARLAMTDLRELVDLVGLIATYNMVSRFVVAFDIQVSDGRL